MPTTLMQNLAKQHGCDVGTVERYWNECKAAIHPTSSEKDGYGVVVNCVKAKLRKLGEVKAVRKGYREGEKD